MTRERVSGLGEVPVLIPLTLTLDRIRLSVAPVKEFDKTKIVYKIAQQD